MATIQIQKTTVVSSSKGGSSGTTLTSGSGDPSQDGGGIDEGPGNDYTYYKVTTDTTYGGSGTNPDPTDTVVLDVPETVEIQDQKGILLTIDITTGITQPVSLIPVFMEVSHDGTNWSTHSDSTASDKVQVIAGLQVADAGVQTFYINTEDMRFPRVRLGFNSNGVNLDGLVFSMGFTYVDKWIDPAKYRNWLAKPGE